MYLIFSTILFITCINNDFLPSNNSSEFEISNVIVVEGNAGTTTGKLEIMLISESNKPITVDFETKDASAFAGQDYKPRSGSLTFDPSNEKQSIEVEIIADEQKEGEEYFLLQLYNPNDKAVITEGKITIQDDDDEIVYTNTGYSTPDSYQNWDLVWKDDFTEPVLNTNSWNYVVGNGCPDLCGFGNNELEYYTDRPNNIRLEDGNLVIEAHKETWEGHEYTSARINTKNKKSFQYGRIDIRAKLPEGEGIWPALWMLGANIDEVKWPVCGEIDIMELIGFDPSTVHGTVHYGQLWPNNQLDGSHYSIAPEKFSEQFHVFSLVWEENAMWWYVDDVIYKEITPADLGNQDYPFNKDLFFIFNLAVGGNLPGPPDDTTVFPQQLVVDYIRVFQRN